MSTLSTTTDVAATPEYVESNVLEKIESQGAPGEFTPVPIASPAGSFRDQKLEQGETKDDDRQPAITRPTGVKV